MMPCLLGAVGRGEKDFAKFEAGPRVNSALTISDDGRTLTSAVEASSHRIAYLNDKYQKTSGIWAIETWTSINEVDSGGYTYHMVGLGDTPTNQINPPGVYSDSIGILYALTRRYEDSGFVSLSTTKIIAAATRRLFVFDFDFDTVNHRPRMGVEKNGALVFYPVITAADTAFFIGTSLYDGIAENDFTVYFNMGQNAFAPVSETALSNYEISNAVTINRGLWA